MSDYWLGGFKLTYTPETRKRSGIKFLLDYKTPDQGIIKLNLGYNRTERELSIFDRNLPVNYGEVSYNFRAQDINTDIKNVALHGENYISNWQINWNLSQSESGSETPYDYNMHFNEPSDGFTSGMSASMPRKEFKRLTSYEKIIPYALNNFDKAYYTSIQSTTTSSLDYEKTAFIDVKKPYNLLGFSGEVKFGSKYRSKYHRRNVDLRQALNYNGNGFYDSVKVDNKISPKDFEAYGFDNLIWSNRLIMISNFLDSSTRDIFGRYTLNPTIDADRVRNWYKLNINGYSTSEKRYEYRVDHSKDGSNYNLTESVTSGYLMNTLNMGKYATFISGVRIEQDNNEYHAFYADQEVDFNTIFKDTTSTHIETVVLPNFHFIVRPTDFMNIRLAAFKGLERPNFNLRLPTYIHGSGNSGNISVGERPYVIKGNTDLKNAYAWNYEVNTQFYGNEIGLLSLSVFYKKIDNEVHQYWYVPVIGKETTDKLGLEFPENVIPYTGQFQLIYPYNSDKDTKVWGFEVEHQANMLFLPGLLSNIVLSYNISLVKSETYSPAYKTVYDSVLVNDPFFGEIWTVKPRIHLYERRTRLTNSPELFGNLAIGYDIGGFSGRLSYFYQGDYYSELPGDNRTNKIQKSFGRLDFALKYKLTEMFSIGLNVNNLNNIKEGEFRENSVVGWKRQISAYRYGTTADLWLKVSL